jgi:ATP-binding cassette, subfamily B, bacterial
MQSLAQSDRPFSLIARYVWRHRWLHGLVLLAIIAASLASVGSRYSMKFLVDAVAAGPDEMGTIWMVVAIFTAFVGADNMLWRVAGWAAARAFPSVGLDLRLDLFKHLLGQSARYFSERFAGALANRITGAATAVFTIESTFTWNVLPPAAAIVGALGTLVLVEWHMAAVLTVIVTVVALVMAVAALGGRSLHHELAGHAAAVGGDIVDVVTNHGTVRAFAAAPREYERLSEGLNEEVVAHRRALIYMERLRFAHAVCVWVLSGGMLAWAAVLWQAGQISAGDLVVIGSFSIALLQASRDLAVALVEIAHHWGRLGEAVQALVLPHDLPDQPGASDFVSRGGSIVFENVTFAYSGGRNVLDRISLDVPAGQKVGIVGTSGAGKTTLLALMQRLYPITGGRIIVDGQDIAEVAQNSLRKTIAVVPQDVSLFHRSILENIRYGRPDASDAEVIAASRAAQCDEFIRELPQGYATPVGERGIRLSGGQRQRVGIARAILTDAPVILLDEATSALDTQSEMAIQRALDELMRGRTVLAVAHRLSTIAGFDRVIVLRNGRVAEDGAPEELVRANGIFGTMWRVQMGQPSPEEAWADHSLLPFRARQKASRLAANIGSG